jgi:hypothetical protein
MVEEIEKSEGLIVMIRIGPFVHFSLQRRRIAIITGKIV